MGQQVLVTDAERQLVSDMEAFRTKHLGRVRLLSTGVQSARDLYEGPNSKKEPENEAVDLILHSLAALIELLDKFKLSITNRGGLDSIFINCVLEETEYRCLNEDCTAKRLTRILCLFSQAINHHYTIITNCSGSLSKLRSELTPMSKELNKIIDRYVDAA